MSSRFLCTSQLVSAAWLLSMGAGLPSVSLAQWNAPGTYIEGQVQLGEQGKLLNDTNKDVYQGSDGKAVNATIQNQTYTLDPGKVGGGSTSIGTPSASALFYNSSGGNGGSNNYGWWMNAGDASSVSVSVKNVSITLTRSSSDSSDAAWGAITATSVGGQAGVNSVAQMWPEHKTPKYKDTWGMPTWEMGYVTDSNGYNAWNGTGVPGKYGTSFYHYGQNGTGGDVTINFDGTNVINGTGNHLIGVSANSIGGSTQLPPTLGGAGEWAHGDLLDKAPYFLKYTGNDPGNDTPGASGYQPFPGAGGNATLSIHGLTVSLSGANLVGVVGSSSAMPFFPSTNQDYFKDTDLKAGSVTVSLHGDSSITLSKNGDGASFGVMAVSTGGTLLNPFSSQLRIDGKSYDVPFGVGGSGSVTLTNQAPVSVAGTTAVGLVALSAANDGGVSEVGNRSSSGGRLYKPKDADAVTLSNDNRVRVQGDVALGIVATSAGSGGLLHGLAAVGNGKKASFVHGGAGFATGRRVEGYYPCSSCTYTWKTNNDVKLDPSPAMNDGGSVTVTIESGASVVVGNADRTSSISYGLIAQSIGHAGGVALGGASAQIGSKEGGGGHGKKVTVTNHGSLTTLGESAVGVLAQSIGGGGGAGANSDSLFVALGGSGGSGGNGGSVFLDFYDGSSVVTNGDFAVGVIAHSIGGGGGHGGGAKSTGLFVDTAIGGSGGDGGHGGLISVTSAGKSFWTAGQHAHGMVLQSIGGGGGIGGSANSHSDGVVLAVSVATGGTGGEGGYGFNIIGGDGNDGYDTPVQSSVITNAHNSTAIVLQSIGGGGGIGGAATAKSIVLGLGTLDPELSEVPAIGVSVALGGAGGSGGHGGTVQYWHVGNLSTYGNNSHGILSQSIGGGGGSGGDGTASSQTLGAADTQVNVGMGLGGQAAAGADGGMSWVRVGPWSNSDGSVASTVPTTIRTVGHDAIAVFSQSIGGGGGDAGTGSGFNLSAQFTPDAEAPDDDTLGQAGSDDVGDLNDFEGLPDWNDPSSLTSDASSTAGELDNDIANMDDFEGLDTSGVKTPDPTPKEKTWFTSAMTCLKKSLKTSSIRKGLANCDEDDPDKPSAKKGRLDIAVGRSGAGGGTGGQAEAWLYGNAFTAGAGSHAVFAQSIGGGGGKASGAGADASGGGLNVTINVGGSGGSGATGGSVTVFNGGTIATGQLHDLADPLQTDATKFIAPAVLGSEAHGVFAQSIGGGGGQGGTSDPHSSAASSAIVDLINGKYETAALTALGVSGADIKDLKSGLAILNWGLNGKAPDDFTFSPTINVGGAGGAGGDGGAVSVGNEGTIRTFGHRSFGVFGQSIGGGGGTAGAANGALVDLSGSETMSGISFNPSINVGGAGGAGGDGGDVTYKFTAADSSIVTRGYASYGIALQSIGGGGGVAHEGSTFGLTDTVGLNSDVSVTGGVDFGNGVGSANYKASANSASANGSIAFGAADMPNSKITGVNADRTKNDYGTYSYEKTTAGNSGSGGAINLGTASAPMLGSVQTHGNDAMAIFGQSIGGGGGLATLGCSNASPTNANHFASACWGNTQVSDTAGQPDEFVGGAGTKGVAISVNAAQSGSEKNHSGSGVINVYSKQAITTYGHRSMGIVTQSITGGGGFFSAPNRRIHSVAMPTQQRATNLSPGATTINLTDSTITTHGDGAWGVFAQMVQGGGGFFGDSSQDLAFNVKYSQSEAAASDVFAGSVASGFSQQMVANASYWDPTACESASTCNVGLVTPGQMYLIPYEDGQVDWAKGDYVQLEKSTDSSFPYVLKQFDSNNQLKKNIGTGRVLHLTEDYFLFEGNDQDTGAIFGATDITVESLALSGIVSPTEQQLRSYLQQYFGVDHASQTGNTSTLKQVVNQSFLGATNTPDTWTNQPISVELYKTKVSTYGKNAHGIVLQNLGSVGGVWSSNGSKLNMGITLDGSNGNGNTPGGDVSLAVRENSQIGAYGEGARGVVIQSDGAGPGGNASQGKITVQVSDSSELFAKQHTALMIVGGSFSATRLKTTTSNCGVGCQATTTTYLQNEVTVDSSSRIVNGMYQTNAAPAVDDSDSAHNRWAIYAPTGYTNVTNNGTVTGNVLLGIVTQGDFINQSNGVHSGSTVVVANTSYHNYGTILAGGEGATGGLYIDGSLKHYLGASLHVDVDPLGAGPDNDLITVTDLARIEGEIVPQTQSLLPGDYQFLTAGTLEHSGTIRDAHLFGWDATSNGNTLTMTPTANFAPAGFGLTGNQASMAGYLQRAWDASTADHAPLFGYLHEHDDGAHGDYQATLDELMGETLNTQPIQFQTAFSTYMSESLACPAVTEQGLRLNQDDCAWAKVTGDISDQSSNSSNPGFRATGGGLRLGAQKTVGGGWTVGFGAGYALNYLTSTNFSSNGQFFDLSLSAKKQIEQWEFGASLGFAQGWFQNNRYRTMGANGAAEAMEGVFASDSRMTIMGVRLRAAYEHELQKDHYLKPYVDVDLSYSSMPGFSETGTAPLALKVGSSSRWNVAITPMLEYGLDVLTADKTRVKLFASAGASFLPNNNHKSETSFVGASAALGTFDVITEGPEILGRLNLGIQAFQSDDLEVRAQYGLLAGDGYWSQSVSANLVWRF